MRNHNKGKNGFNTCKAVRCHSWFECLLAPLIVICRSTEAMTGLLSAMPTDILLLCVVVFVTSASTFCCQIFGRMCAKRLLAAKATETDSGERHASRPVRRRRDHVSSSMRSLSSLESLDYASSVTSEGRISRRRWRIRKR